MWAWVTLPLTTLETEYPNFELCQSFTVLGLGDQRKHDLDLAARPKHMERLARACGLDPGELAGQHPAFKPATPATYTPGVLGS